METTAHNSIDERIVRFIGRHHVLTLATSDDEGLWCSNLFYAYDKTEGRFLFSSGDDTRHARQMRANPHIAASVVLETRLVGRVQGANFTSIYGRTKAMGYRNITLPEGHTWKSYTMFLLDTLPPRLRNNYIKKFNTSIDFWHQTGGGLDEETINELLNHGYEIRRNGVSNYTSAKKSRVIFIGKIPDDTDDIKSSKDIPSWKRMCYCILKNDHTCRFMGFGITRQQQKYVDEIRKKYKSLEEVQYGV